jgi:hypothetical protein
MITCKHPSIFAILPTAAWQQVERSSTLASPLQRAISRAAVREWGWQGVRICHDHHRDLDIIGYPQWKNW